MTDSDDLLVRREDGVLALTFNRPAHRNALTQAVQIKHNAARRPGAVARPAFR